MLHTNYAAVGFVFHLLHGKLKVFALSPAQVLVLLLRNSEKDVSSPLLSSLTCESGRTLSFPS